MRRVRFVVSAVVAVVLISSLFFVPGSFAEPLGAGLLDRFGSTSSGQGDVGSEAAPFIFSLPVTVKNQDDEPVPVTVQGNSADPSAQPFQRQLTIDFADDAVSDSNIDFITVPADKRLIIRYVSALVKTGPDQMTEISIRTMASGEDATHYIPMVSAQTIGTEMWHQHGFETWIAVDPGTSVTVGATVRGTAAGPGRYAIISVSGYLVDAPSP